MDDILTRHGFQVAAMKGAAVALERREARVAQKVTAGSYGLICLPAGAD